jgi:hypothetical protein
MYTNQQLRDWATQAADHYRQELDLFGFANEEFAITPAMVRSVLIVVDHAAPVAPAVTPIAGKVMIPHQTRTQAIVDLDDYRTYVHNVLHSLSANGDMPSMAYFDQYRPDNLPTAGAVTKRLRRNWMEIAQDCGLTPPAGAQLTAHKFSRPAPTRPLPSAPSTETREDTAPDFEQQIIVVLTTMAVDGKMPSQKQWDAHRPDTLPSNTSVRNKLGIGWSELAQRAGLAPNVERLANLRKSAEQEADDAEPASQFPQPLSDHARGVLGPEHIAVTPYRNGNERH